MEKLINDQIKSLVETASANHKELATRLSSIESAQLLQNHQLSEHMRRTNLLETATDHHQEELLLLRQESTQRQKVNGRIWKVLLPVLTAFLIKLFLTH